MKVDLEEAIKHFKTTVPLVGAFMWMQIAKNLGFSLCDEVGRLRELSAVKGELIAWLVEGIKHSKGGVTLVEAGKYFDLKAKIKELEVRDES